MFYRTDYFNAIQIAETLLLIEINWNTIDRRFMFAIFFYQFMIYFFLNQKKTNLITLLIVKCIKPAYFCYSNGLRFEYTLDFPVFT